MNKRFLSCVFIMLLAITVFYTTIKAQSKVYIRCDDFESYNLGMIAGSGAVGIRSKDNSYAFNDLVTADKKAGWYPGASNGYELNLVKTKDKNGLDTQAVQIYMPLEYSVNSVSGGLLQMNPYNEVFSGYKKYVYKAMVRNGGDAGESDFSRMYFSYLVFNGRNLFFTTGTNTQTVSNVLPPSGNWFEFMFIADTSTGEVKVAIDGKLVLTNIIEEYKSNGIKGSNPRWGPMYNKINTANAFYIDDAEVYGLDSGNLGFFINTETSIVTNSILINFDYPLSGTLTKENLAVLDSNANVVEISDITYDCGSYKIFFNERLAEGGEYTIALNNISDIAGNVLINELSNFDVPIKRTYFRNDDFEDYQLGLVSGDGADVRGVCSKDGSYWLKGDVTADKKAGIAIGTSNGLQSFMVEVVNDNNSVSQALKIHRAAGIGTGSGVFQFRPDAQSFNTSKYIYRTKMRNGDKAADNGFSGAAFGLAAMDFVNGKITLSGDLRCSPNVNGTDYYVLPPNGEWFVFTYIIDTDTDTLTIAINDEIVGKKVYGGKFTQQAVTTINPRWSFTLNNSGITPPENALYFDFIEAFTTNTQYTGIISKNTAGLTLGFANPVCSDELYKIAVYNEGQKQVIIDYVKNSDKVSLFFKTALETGERYVLEIDNLADTYGNIISKQLEFTVSESGELIIGGYLPPANVNIITALACEEQSAWRTESNLTEDNGFSLSDLVIGSAFETQSYGATLCSERKTQGNYSIKWENHPFYSTLNTKLIPSDLSGANVLSFWAYSENATNETIMVTLYSDNEKTPWKDGYVYPLKINWTGEKHIKIPLKEFLCYENPKGFHKIDGLYFHTKIFGLQPNPYTVLYFDAFCFEYDELYPITITNGYRIEEKDYEGISPFDYDILNHSYPEQNVVSSSPIQYEAYYKAERAVLGYYPKFNPSLPSFDNNGKPYLKYGSTHIQYMGEDGKWKVINLKPYVDEYVRNNSTVADYKFLDSDFYGDTVIRFDEENNVYINVSIQTDKYIGLLLYSNDDMHSWSIYELPYPFARFERVDGNNSEALNRPPLILLHNWWIKPQDQGGYMLLPFKNADGSLNLSRIVKYADSCICSATHSGDANMAISADNKIFVIYGVYNAETEGVPENHPGKELSFERNGTAFYFKNGIPTFIKCYDLEKRILSDPVFVGFGGHAIDDHNWPALTIGSDGILHVLINGHHDPIYYTYSLRPYDITEWAQPELVGSSTSYASVTMDRDNTIYAITRNTERGYRFDLALHRKKANSPWESTSFIVQRFKPYYEVWRNRIAINPQTGKLYVTYFAQSDIIDIFKDEYDALLYTWPNFEKGFLNTYISGVKNNLPVGTDRTIQFPRTKYIYPLQGSEPVLLISDNNGDSFRIALSEDFKTGIVAENSKLYQFDDDINSKTETGTLKVGNNCIVTKVENLTKECKNAIVICIIKKNGIIDNIIMSESRTLMGNTSFENTTIFSIPDNNKYTAEIFVWDSVINLKSYRDKQIFKKEK